MRQKITLLLFSLMIYAITNAQSVGIGTNTPNTSAALDISSSTGSLLLPRLTTTQRDALAPTPGMLIQNTTLDAIQAYSSPAAGPAFIDQSQTTGTFATCVTTLAQSFTAGATGNLQSVTVEVTGGLGPATLNIRNGAGTGGAVIYTQAINATVSAGTEQEFILTTAPALTSGSIYTIEFTYVVCNFAIRYATTNAYAAGQLYINGSASPTADLYFKTKMTTLSAGGWKTIFAGNSTGAAGNGMLLSPGEIAGNIPYWNGSNWITNSGVINNSGINIGIGTTNPQNKLDVEGAMVIGATYSGTNTSPLNGLLIEGAAGIGTTNPQNKLDVEGAMVIGTAYSGANIAPANGLLVQGNVGIGTTSAVNKLSVAGKVNITDSLGIGTTNPSAKLHVAGNQKIDGINTLEFGSGFL